MRYRPSQETIDAILKKQMTDEDIARYRRASRLYKISGVVAITIWLGWIVTGFLHFNKANDILFEGLWASLFFWGYSIWFGNCDLHRMDYVDRLDRKKRSQ
jgi:hypothetical protein